MFNKECIVSKKEFYVPPIFRPLKYNMHKCVTYTISLVHTCFSLKVYSNFYTFSSRYAIFVADLITAQARVRI